MTFFINVMTDLNIFFSLIFWYSVRALSLYLQTLKNFATMLASYLFLLFKRTAFLSSEFIFNSTKGLPPAREPRGPGRGKEQSLKCLKCLDSGGPCLALGNKTGGPVSKKPFVSQLNCLPSNEHCHARCLVWTWVLKDTLNRKTMKCWFPEIKANFSPFVFL